MNRNYLFDKDFLNLLDNSKIKEHFIRISVLSFDENRIISEIQGIATNGSISVNGTSAIRRTLSLTLAVTEKENDISNISNIISLNKKIKLEIGLKNSYFYLNDYSKYGEIIWFPLGIFVIEDASSSITANSATISIKGKDKMSLLDGTCGGTLPATVIFHEVQVEDANGEIYIENPTIFTIIKQCVSYYGKEKNSNIIINDLEEVAKQSIRYNGNEPIWFTENYESFQIGKEAPENPDYLAHKYVLGQSIGYMETPLTYPGELIFEAGNTVADVLKKIIDTLGNYECFYDLEGRFIFQEKKNYLNNYYTPITDLNDYYYIKSFSDTKYYDLLNNSEQVISYNKSPQYKNIKNDFIVWGNKTIASGVTSSLKYHLAIDEKPILNLASQYLWKIEDGKGNLINYISDIENKNFENVPNSVIDLNLQFLDSSNDIINSINDYIKNNIINHSYQENEFILYFKILWQNEIRYYKVKINKNLEDIQIEYLSELTDKQREYSLLITCGLPNEKETVALTKNQQDILKLDLQLAVLFFQIKILKNKQEKVDKSLGLDEFIKDLENLYVNLFYNRQVFLSEEFNTSLFSNNELKNYFDSYFNNLLKEKQKSLLLDFLIIPDSVFTKKNFENKDYKPIYNGIEIKFINEDLCGYLMTIFIAYNGQNGLTHYKFEALKELRNLIYTKISYGEDDSNYTDNQKYKGYKEKRSLNIPAFLTVDKNNFFSGQMELATDVIFNNLDYTFYSMQLVSLGKYVSVYPKGGVVNLIYGKDNLIYQTFQGYSINNDDNSNHIITLESILEFLEREYKNEDSDINVYNFLQFKNKNISLNKFQANKQRLLYIWLSFSQNINQKEKENRKVFFEDWWKYQMVQPQSEILHYVPLELKENEENLNDIHYELGYWRYEKDLNENEKISWKKILRLEDSKINYENLNQIFNKLDINIDKNFKFFIFNNSIINSNEFFELDFESILEYNFKNRTKQIPSKDIRYGVVGNLKNAINENKIEFFYNFKKLNDDYSANKRKKLITELTEYWATNLNAFQKDLKLIIDKQNEENLEWQESLILLKDYVEEILEYYNQLPSEETIDYLIQDIENYYFSCYLNKIELDEKYIIKYLAYTPLDQDLDFKENLYYSLIGSPCEEWREELYRQALFNSIEGNVKGDYDEELIAFWRENFDTENIEWEQDWYSNYLGVLSFKEIQEFINYLEIGEEVSEKDINSLKFWGININKYFELKENNKFILIDLINKNEIDYSKKWKGWNPMVYTDPGTIHFWLDFLDNESLVSKFSVNQIGRRTKTISKDNLKYLYKLEVPDVIFLENKGNEDEINEKILEFQQIGQKYCYLKSNELKYFVSDSSGSSAFDLIREMLHESIILNTNITINTIPKYYLEPNNIIYVYDEKSNICGDYIISSFTIPLQYNGTMSITANEALIRV